MKNDMLRPTKGKRVWDILCDVCFQPLKQEKTRDNKLMNHGYTYIYIYIYTHTF